MKPSNSTRNISDSSDMDMDELHSHIGSGIVGMGLRLASEGALLGLSVGSVALNQLGSFIEHFGNELVQGALAAGILYWHGIDLAAEVLARTREHRDSPALRRTIMDCAMASAASAGEKALHGAARELRQAYRDRRMKALKSLPHLASTKLGFS